METVLEQQGVEASLRIVVNGNRIDRALHGELERTPGVRVYHQEVASIFLARRLARENVQSEFFGFLDDDDVLLPGALRARVDALANDPAVDVVVTNGIVVDGDREMPRLRDLDAIRRDPLMALMHANWLATASALFRTRSIPPDFFDVTIRSNDMTWLAFRLALEKKILFLEQSTYRKEYSPNSISLSEEWQLPALATLEKMLGFPMPKAVRRELRRKCAEEAHVISDLHLRHGRSGPAWRYHLRSMATPGGLWRYALYTRRLVSLSLRQALGGQGPQ